MSTPAAARAAFKSGAMYCRGEGVTKDLATARELCERAAVGGESDAACNLGYIYHRGEGGAKDSAKACGLYELALEGGDSNAADNRGLYVVQCW